MLFATQELSQLDQVVPFDVPVQKIDTSIEPVNLNGQERLPEVHMDALYSPALVEPELKDWVRAARKQRGWTQEQLGDAMGVTKGNVSGWENGRHRPNWQQMLKIEQLTGCAIPHQKRLMGADGDATGLAPLLAWEHPDDLPAGELVMVPRLEVRAADDGGVHVQVELLQDNPQAFRAEWIRLMHLKPGKLAAMRASGDSMVPTIYDGDSLLVDTSQTAIVDGKVYALWYAEAEHVKRLFRLPGGGLRIHSDNKDKDTYPDITLRPGEIEHVRVIGRVVHRSGAGGL